MSITENQLADKPTQHTPGPWSVAVTADSRHVYAPDPNGAPGDGDIVTVADYISSDANARLIAAAPELLDALRTLVAAYEDPQLDDPHALVLNAKAAIVKAEGRG